MKKILGNINFDFHYIHHKKMANKKNNFTKTLQAQNFIYYTFTQNKRGEK